MKHLLLVSIMLLGMSPAAFGGLTAVLSPSIVPYGPGTDPSICDLTGTAPCVQFSGTLTDTDMDGSLLLVNGISVTFSGTDGNYLSLDSNVFYNDAAGILVGDPNAATDMNPFSNTYTGVLFGIDITTPLPAGLYVETVEFDASGGTDGSALADVSFTIDAPEPSTAVLILAGLIAVVAWRRRIC